MSGYRFDGSTPDPLVGIERITTGVARFKEQLREEGVHVGLGTPPICVTCDRPFPCDEVDR